MIKKYENNTEPNSTELDNTEQILFQTIENKTVNISPLTIPKIENLNWDEFKYYQDLYITNINETKGQYIVTEAARGPKNYLRIVSD